MEQVDKFVLESLKLPCLVYLSSTYIPKTSLDNEDKKLGLYLEEKYFFRINYGSVADITNYSSKNIYLYSEGQLHVLKDSSPNYTLNVLFVRDKEELYYPVK